MSIAPQIELIPDTILDFAEASVFSSDGFRATRVEAVFNVKSYRKIQGYRVKGEVRIDYGIFFDPDNHYIRAVMSHYWPWIDWTELIFHRSMDSSRIFISPWDSFDEVGEIRLRGHRRHRGQIDPVALTDPKVISLSEARRLRDERRAVDQSK